MLGRLEYKYISLRKCLYADVHKCAYECMRADMCVKVLVIFLASFCDWNQEKSWMISTSVLIWSNFYERFLNHKQHLLFSFFLYYLINFNLKLQLKQDIATNSNTAIQTSNSILISTYLQFNSLPHPTTVAKPVLVTSQCSLSPGPSV